MCGHSRRQQIYQTAASSQLTVGEIETNQRNNDCILVRPDTYLIEEPRTLTCYAVRFAIETMAAVFRNGVHYNLQCSETYTHTHTHIYIYTRILYGNINGSHSVNHWILLCHTLFRSTHIHTHTSSATYFFKCLSKMSIILNYLSK